MSEGRDLLTDFNESDELVQAIENNHAQATTLMCADLDKDGVRDLICGLIYNQRGITTFFFTDGLTQYTKRSLFR